MKALGFALAISLFACSNPAEHELTESESSAQSPGFWLDSAAFYIDKTRFEDLVKFETEVSERYAYFQSEYTDTRDRDFWVVELSKLERVNKAVMRAKSDREGLPEELKLGREQWSDWQKADAKKAFEPELGLRYLEDERRASNDLYRKARFRHNETQACIELWIDLKPTLDSARQAFESGR
jgi:hypothetical protein